MEKVSIYTDGACRGNPGPGGYGVLIVHDKNNKAREIKGGEKHTTNNRMELIGAIVGLKQIKKPSEIKLFSDSSYLVKGMNKWIKGWIKKKWRNSSGAAVKNKDLWEELLLLSKDHKIYWNWIKGHAGHAENERCDILANEAIDQKIWS